MESLMDIDIPGPGKQAKIPYLSEEQVLKGLVLHRLQKLFGFKTGVRENKADRLLNFFDRSIQGPR